MPQPSLDIHKYLDHTLPHLYEKYPPGTGGTGARTNWPEGTLKAIEVVPNFAHLSKEYVDSYPQGRVNPNPYAKYPKQVQVTRELPNPLRSTGDLQKALAALPLAGISSILTALESGPKGYPLAPRADQAGYESDGGEDDHEEERTNLPRDESKEWHWRYSKSPMGSGELLLVKGDTDVVTMVVRTINSAAFTAADWDEYIVTGPYSYNTKSKASWYWSRMWGACKRLQTKYFVLTDWQHWSFGCFNDDQTHAWISPVLWYNAMSPTINEALFYWAQIAKGAPGATPLKERDVSSLPALFPSNPARRVSVSGKAGHVPRDPSKAKNANESDIEESDAEDA